MGEEAVKAAYITAHLFAAAVTVTLGHWIVRRTTMRARRWFGAFAGLTAAWSVTDAVVVAAPPSTLLTVATVSSASFGIASALSVLCFAVAFTGRGVSSAAGGASESAADAADTGGGAVTGTAADAAGPRVGNSLAAVGGSRVVRGFAAAAAVLYALVWSWPVHDLYVIGPVVTTPFAHLEPVAGPVNVLTWLYALAAVGVTYYYLYDLARVSRRRPSTAVFVIAVGLVVALVPFVLSRAGVLLVGTYDHTSLGVLIVAVSFAYATVRLELVDVVPVARDEAITALADPYLAVEPGGRLVDYNVAAGRLFGLSEEEVGRELAVVAPELNAELSAVATDGGETEVAVPSGDGVRQFDLSVSRGPRGSEQFLLREITGRKERERRLRRQNERLERFAGILSHDLRNPLNVAQGHLELAAETGERERFDVVRRQHDRMEAMIDDLLGLARAGRTVEDSEPVGLREVVVQAWEHSALDDCDLECVVSEEVVVRADRSRLLHVFENLFRNADNHNSEPVVVRVGTFIDPGGDGRRRGIFVADDGVGIPADDRSAVFDHGYTSSEDGTGLGLSIVRTVVEAHGWEIQVTEGQAGGARFEITGVEFE